MSDNSRTGFRLGVALLAAGILAAGILAALGADPCSATTYLPSIRIGTAALVSPNSADAYYGQWGDTSTDKLKTYTGVDTPTAPEIVELARALKNDPDLIYQYVENNVQTVWMYGLQKGALGAEIDKSGTPFDQAELMVALLGQANITASYVAGTIKLDQTGFYNWTGITSALAACQLLSGGGIPATINGINNSACSAFSSTDTVSAVRMAHIWVQATISGSHSSGCSSGDVCVFDPSYKSYNWKPGIDLASAMGFVSGDSYQAATSWANYKSGTDVSGAPWASTLNASGTGGLNAKLQSYAAALLSSIQSQHLQGMQMEDLIGGGVITPVTTSVRQASLPYADPSPPYPVHVWTPSSRYNAIPDQYRTTFETKGFMTHYSDLEHGCNPSDALMFDPTFYVDEIYGRRLSVATDFTFIGINDAGDPGYAESNTIVTLMLDGANPANLPPYTNYANDCFKSTRGLPAHIQLFVSHPYAASADGTPTTHGDYMDATVDKPVVLITSLSIVHGWGDVSPELFTKWSSESRNDRLPKPIDCFGELCAWLRGFPTGNFDREKTNADWLSQYTRAAQLNASLAHSVIQLHHAIGFVYADNDLLAVQRYPGYPSDENIASSFDRIDVDGGVSATSKSANAADRRGALHSFAAAAAALEGSVSTQLADVVDPASTATRFEWANNPPADPSGSHQNPRGLGPQRFYEFNSTTASAAAGLVKTEGYLVNDPGHGADNTDCPDQDGTTPWRQQPLMSEGECISWGEGLTTEIGNYAAQGYDVIMPQEAFLGPGQRGGSFLPDSFSHPTQYQHYAS
ncbi:MAG: hypothetical protein JO208_02235, partial [Alphaproteobacteria bacterium]|nr:hypothetical protein [Alphaproteobacteria bacterium]